MSDTVQDFLQFVMQGYHFLIEVIIVLDGTLNNEIAEVDLDGEQLHVAQFAPEMINL